MRLSIVVAAVCLLAACAPVGSSPGWTAPPAEPSSASTADTGLVMTVYKSPTCGCCHEWEAYLRARGVDVRSVPTDDMSAVKVEHGLPDSTWSCHTAIVDGYVVEGHVPFEAIEDLLAERPAIDAIALPGMPAGSPGMPGVKVAPFEILSITDGKIGTFGSY
jgi:hypothetical protein